MSRAEVLGNIRAGLSSLADSDGNVQIKGVDVQGRCAVPLVASYIQPLLDASSVDDLASAINKVQIDLYSLGLFSDVGISLTEDRVISVKLPAKKKFLSRIGTSVGQSEGSGYLQGTLTNYSGWGEIITVDTSTGTRTRSSHILNASVPLPFRSTVGWRAEALGYSSERFYEWSSCRAVIKGMSLRFSKGLQCSFGVDAVLRTMASTKISGNEGFFDDMGQSFKSSIFHSWRQERRVPNELVTGDGEGYMAELRNELAVTPSTFPFYKLSAKFNSAYRVYKKVTGSFNVKAGYIVPFGTPKTHYLDRFTLGGPLDLRGFRLNHAGPHANGDALGGNLMLATGLSVYTPLPRVESNAIRLHKFINVGYLGPFALPTPSVSAGIGLSYTHPSAKFELNIVLPLVARANELVHKGLQFGVGLEFL